MPSGLVEIFYPDLVDEDVQYQLSRLCECAEIFRSLVNILIGKRESVASLPLVSALVKFRWDTLRNR